MKCRSLVFVAILIPALVSSLPAAQPWDSAFYADTTAILAASGRIAPPEHPEAIILLEDYRYLIHSDGRIDTTIRKVYRVEQQDAVEDWSSIEQPYQPWYQQTPELKARVIGKDGTVRWLDAKTTSDAPARQFDSSIFSDERVLRAPRPGVEAGAIVETEIVVRDKAPLLDAGVAQRVAVPDTLPVERFHIIIDAEKGVNLRTASQLIPESAVRRTTADKGMRVECEIGPIAARKHFEWNQPSDTAASPYLAFSTGKSWQAIAARYESIVDQRIQNTDLKTLIEGIDLKGSPMEVAARLTARLHKSVRYTGVEFGEAAIIPAPPAETMKRGYGDCKDKAALLVAMLRAAGLKADLALLEADTGLDVDAGLPGMGVFNHAIVYVASEPPLWIDATAADMRVGYLPAADTGRLALIANRATESMVKTPEAESKQSVERHKMEVRMSDMGLGTLQATIEASGGSSEPMARAAYGGDDKKSKEQLETFVKQSFAAKSIGKYEVMRRDDLSGPFRMTVEARDAQVANTGGDDAGVALTPWLLFQKLPYALKSDPGEDAKDDKARQHDFVVSEPYQMELDYVIFPPALFKPAKLPASTEAKLGPALFSAHFEAKPDGSVEAIYRFDSGKRRMTAAEFIEFRAKLADHLKRSPELITFVPETSEYLALGQMSKAVGLLREQVSHDPKNAKLHLRFANILLNAGLGDVALEEAKTAADLDAKSGETWSSLGWIYQHDSFGRLRQGDWNPAEGEKALRKAVELEPEDMLARTNLAILLEYNAQGWRYGTGSRTPDAIALYRELAKKQQHPPMVDQNLGVALMRTGQLAAAKEALSKLSGELPALLLDTITAIEETPARAIVKAQAAYPDPRERAIHLGSVAQTLVTIRRYDAAATMMGAAARQLNIPDLQTRVELLGKLKRWQDVMLPEDDPRSPVQKLVLAAFRGELTLELLKSLSTTRAEATSPTSEEWADLQALVAKARQGLSSVGLEEESLLDFIVSLIDFDKTGDDEHGYRVKIRTPGTASTCSYYVIREDGKYRVLGSGAVGGFILELLAKKNVKGAQWWLDRAVSDGEAHDDGTGRPAVTGLWSGVKEETRGPAEIRVAAAALIGSSTGSPKALAELEAARLKAPTTLEKSQVDKAICETLAAGQKWNDLMVAAKRLETSKLFHEEGFRYFVKGATRAKNWKELEVESLRALDSNKEHVVAMRTVALARSRQGDAKGAAQWIKKLSDSKLAGADEQIYAAWVTMAQGKADQDALASLKKAKDGAGSRKDYEYALAMMQTLLGMADDAQPGLAAAIVGEDLATVPGVAWAVHGKICEQYGFGSCAKSSLDNARKTAEKKANDESAEWLLAVLDR